MTEKSTTKISPRPTQRPTTKSTKKISTSSNPPVSQKIEDMSPTPNPTQISRREMFQQRRADRRHRRVLCKKIKGIFNDFQLLNSFSRFFHAKSLEADKL